MMMEISNYILLILFRRNFTRKIQRLWSAERNYNENFFYQIYSQDFQKNRGNGYLAGWDEFDPEKHHATCTYQSCEEYVSDITNFLGHLFMKFNFHHPEDFKGHSLSCGDVVSIYELNKNHRRYFLCLSLGWQEIKTLKNVEFPKL